MTDEIKALLHAMQSQEGNYDLAKIRRAVIELAAVMSEAGILDEKRLAKIVEDVKYTRYNEH